MPDADIVVFVEEASAAEIVRAVARKLGVANRVLVLKHQGAGDLERSLTLKVTKEPNPKTKFLVLRDADNYDCKAIKAKLMQKVPVFKRPNAIVRIVCQELESWYLAQPEALGTARVLKNDFAKSVRRADPDSINDPKRVLARHSHAFGQIQMARRVAPHLDIDATRSRSFVHFVTALRRLADLA